MVSEKRSQRIADRLREELSVLLLEETSDPRLDGISITEVKVESRTCLCQHLCICAGGI